jgi:hypothetical protein
MKALSRVWISDYKGKPRGFDPVFDTFEYLRLTGQVEGTPGKKGFVITGFDQLKGIHFDWPSFKKLILCEDLRDREGFNAIQKKLKIKSEIKLRQVCFKQLKKGTAMDLYYQSKLKGSSAADEDDLEGDDE